MGHNRLESARGQPYAAACAKLRDRARIRTMPPLDDETSTWTSSEVAGLRNVAWGAAMVMAGLLAVLQAE